MTSAMRHILCNRLAADSVWGLLEAELDAWSRLGRKATFWWRDDDADSACPALEKLLSLQGKTGVPLALAVVPHGLDTSLAAALSTVSNVSILQHGYSHANFAKAGERKIELDGSRPAAYVIADLAVGLQTLSSMPDWWPVLVPPWNRIESHLIPMLPDLGYRGLSVFGARDRAAPVMGLRLNNVHVDPVDWRGRFGPAGAFIGEERALAALTGHLRDRREGRADIDEATGLMSHHKVQPDGVWAFIENLIAVTRNHSAVRWCAVPELFQ